MSQRITSGVRSERQMFSKVESTRQDEIIISAIRQHLGDKGEVISEKSQLEARASTFVGIESNHHKVPVEPQDLQSIFSLVGEAISAVDDGKGESAFMADRPTGGTQTTARVFTITRDNLSGLREANPELPASLQHLQADARVDLLRKRGGGGGGMPHIDPVARRELLSIKADRADAEHAEQPRPPDQNVTERRKAREETPHEKRAKERDEGSHQ